MQTLKEYSPEEILLNTVELENVTHEYEDWKKPEEKRSKYKEITISFAINLLFNCVAIFPSFFGFSSRKKLGKKKVWNVSLFVHFKHVQ